MFHDINSSPLFDQNTTLPSVAIYIYSSLVLDEKTEDIELHLHAPETKT